MMAREYGEAEEYQYLDEEEIEARELAAVHDKVDLYRAFAQNICERAADSGEELGDLADFEGKQPEWLKLEREYDYKRVRLGAYIDRVCAIFFPTHLDTGKILNAVAVTTRLKLFLELLADEYAKIRMTFLEGNWVYSEKLYAEYYNRAKALSVNIKDKSIYDKEKLLTEVRNLFTEKGGVDKEEAKDLVTRLWEKYEELDANEEVKKKSRKNLTN
jgi:hypothetical protein